MIYSRNLSRLRESLVRNGRSERGTTLVEIMVVIVIMSIMSYGIIYLMTAMFDSNIQANEMAEQQSNAQSIRSSVGALSYGLTNVNLGQVNGAGKITSMSLAGDGFYGELPDQGICFRLYYVARSKQLRQATQPSASCSDIKPVRGANETVPPHGSCQAPCYQAEVGTPPYDKVLDGAVNSVLVADKVVTNANGTGTSISGFGPFIYLDKSGSQIYGDRLSFEGNSSVVYNEDPAINSQIGSIEVRLYLAGSYDGATSRVSAKLFSQRLTLIGE
jgi:prepilin-type N-terminal cleavage/methylation domain-containing protein